MSGKGWRVCDKNWSVKLPPAESPARMTFEGEVPLANKCVNAALISRSWDGKGDNGARAMVGENF